MNGESSIATSLRIGRPRRWTSKRSMPDAAKTATPRAPLASNSVVYQARMRSTSLFSSARSSCVSGVLAKLALDRVEQRFELDRAPPRSRKLARVEVEIEAEDLVALRPQGRAAHAIAACSPPSGFLPDFGLPWVPGAHRRKRTPGFGARIWRPRD